MLELNNLDEFAGSSVLDISLLNLDSAICSDFNAIVSIPLEPKPIPNFQKRVKNEFCSLDDFNSDFASHSNNFHHNQTPVTPSSLGASNDYNDPGSFYASKSFCEGFPLNFEFGIKDEEFSSVPDQRIIGMTPQEEYVPTLFDELCSDYWREDSATVDSSDGYKKRSNSECSGYPVLGQYLSKRAKTIAMTNLQPLNVYGAVKGGLEEPKPPHFLENVIDLSSTMSQRHRAAVGNANNFVGDFKNDSKKSKKIVAGGVAITRFASSGNGAIMTKEKWPSVIKKTQQPTAFVCSYCSATFKVKGYLTRHMKKHVSTNAFVCPFFKLSCDKISKSLRAKKLPIGSKCHPTGGFSRRDTFKTHLKALHFIYPAGTKSAERGDMGGRCAGCFEYFDNNIVWLEQHIEKLRCKATVKE